MTWSIECADVLDWAANYEGPKFHACLCDPPYHLKGGFMGKTWDKDGPEAVAFQPETWKAIAGHLHPGTFIVAFGGSRTHHRMAVAMEDAGLVLHPTMVWLNGQSFPKATRIDTQIDKAAGAEREVIGRANNNTHYETSGGFKGGNYANSRKDGAGTRKNQSENADFVSAPATPLAQTWAGHRYGLQALKPCAEFILVAQKPYEGKPVECIVNTGAGALWIDGCRVATGEELQRVQNPTALGQGSGWNNHNNKVGETFGSTNGRWPSNVVLSHIPPRPDGNGGWLPGCERMGVKRVRGAGWRQDDKEPPSVDGWGSITEGRSKHYADPDGTEQVDDWACVDGCPIKALGEMSGETKGGGKGLGQGHGPNGYSPSSYAGSGRTTIDYPDKGTAARFYPNFGWQHEIAERLAGVVPFRYVAKAGRKERNAGLEEFPVAKAEHNTTTNYCARCDKRVNSNGSGVKCECGDKRITQHKTTARNPHPTIKPIELCKWLATLILPPPEYAPRRILVPFGGVMSEAIGAVLAGWDEVVAIEMEGEYCTIGEARLRFWSTWAERGYDDPKAILKVAKREETKREKAQLELSL